MRGRQGTIFRMVIVAVAAVLIGGGLAAPVDAKQRPEAAAANEFVTWCFNAGGDIGVIVVFDDGGVSAECIMPGNNGGYFICRFEGVSQDCSLVSRSVLAGDSAVPGLGGLHTLQARGEESSPRTPVAAAAAGSQDDGQVHEAKKKKQAKKGKHGKGKAKGHGKSRGGR